jgi:hypothetical protein
MGWHSRGMKTRSEHAPLQPVSSEYLDDGPIRPLATINIAGTNGRALEIAFLGGEHEVQLIRVKIPGRNDDTIPYRLWRRRRSWSGSTS